MPMWNGAIFAAAAAMLAAMLLLFPLRRELFILGLVAGLSACRRSSISARGTRTPAAHHHRSPLGFHCVENAGIFNVIWYLIFTFGFKWLLVAIALIAARGFQRRLFIAATIYRRGLWYAVQR